MSTSFRPNGLPVPRSRLPGTLVRVVEPPPPVTPVETGNITVPEDPQELEPAICPIGEKTPQNLMRETMQFSVKGSASVGYTGVVRASTSLSSIS